MATLPLTKGYVATVDDDDFAFLSQWKWTAVVTGQNVKRVYAYRRQYPERKIVYLHREIMGAQYGTDVDHINSDTLDNRRQNLRLATRSENLANNRRAVGITGYRGVTTDHRDGAFIAQCGGRYLGRFKTDVEAAEAYDEAAFQRFGEFARLNFSSELAPNGQEQAVR